jgi:hypothetical protein
MTRTVALLSTVILLLALRGQATLAGEINFDDYPVGRLSFADSMRYLSVGAIFDREIPIYSVASMEAPWWVATFSAGGGTLPNVMGLSPTVDPRRSIDMSFVVPGTNTAAATSFVKVLFADSEVGTTIGRLDAYGADGSLLASLAPTTPNSSTALLTIDNPGIARLRFTDVDDGFEIDNISFATPVAVAAVPLPPAWQLLLVGLGTVVGRVLSVRRRESSPRGKFA